MAADMTIEPWSRLTKIAPPGTDPNDLQAAADRYALTADINAAAADLWEELAMTIDINPDEGSASAGGAITSVSQDGISVSYSQDSVSEGNTQNARTAQHASYMARARYYRSKSKPRTALFDGRRRDPYDYEYDPTEDDVIIPVIP